MSIIAWVATAVIVLHSGEVGIHVYPDPFKTEAECKKLNEEALKKLDRIGVIALGVACSPVEVQTVLNPVISSKPLPKTIEM